MCVSVCVYSKVNEADGSTESPRLQNNIFIDPRCTCRCMTWRAPLTRPGVLGFMEHARWRRAKHALMGAARRHLDRARPPAATAPFWRWRRAAARTTLLRSGLPDSSLTPNP